VIAEHILRLRHALFYRQVIDERGQELWLGRPLFDEASKLRILLFSPGILGRRIGTEGQRHAQRQQRRRSAVITRTHEDSLNGCGIREELFALAELQNRGKQPNNSRDSG
jgi:hypothetical protein